MPVIVGATDFPNCRQRVALMIDTITRSSFRRAMKVSNDRLTQAAGSPMPCRLRDTTARHATARRDDITRVLLVGLLPETVDTSDPILPPGLTAEKIQAGIDLGLKHMTDRGWHAEACLIRPDATAGPTVAQRLAATTYDCIVIGAGVRLPPRNLLLLETVVNVVKKAAPSASIAFNTVPEDSADAAARWVSSSGRDP